MKNIQHIHGSREDTDPQDGNEKDQPKEGGRLPEGDEWLKDVGATFGTGSTYGARVELRTLVQNVPLIVPKGETTFFRSHEKTTDIFGYLYSPEGKLGKEVYVVAPPFVESFPGILTRMMLIPFTTMGGRIGVWPQRLENKRGESDDWVQSAMAAYRASITTWINLRVGSDGYTWTPAVDQNLGEPKWPISTDEMLGLALKGRVIDNFDHPVCKALQGRR